mgnify:FL=1
MTVALLSNIPLPRKGKTAPREVRLFKFGANRTTKGVFILTKESAAAALADYTAQGHALTWDYDHATFTAADPQHRIAAGSCRLAVRADGLWAVDIEWTAKAKAAIEAGEWAFCSPALKFNAKREITGVRNVALTNLPATHGATPLLLNDARNHMTQYLKDMRAGYEAAMSAAQAMQAGSDEAQKQLGAKAIEGLAPLISALEELIEAAGEGAEGEGELSALRGLRTLTAELLSAKDASVPELRGKLRALVQRSKTSAATAQSAEKTAVLSLVKANLRKIPAADRAAYEAMPLVELQAFLSDAPDLTSGGAAPQQPHQPPAKAKTQDEIDADAGVQEILNAVNRGKRPAGGAAASAEDADAADILNKVNRRAQARA